MTEPTLSFRVDEETIAFLDRMAEKYDYSRSELARHLLENGTRAHKYYEEFSVAPEDRTT